MAKELNRLVVETMKRQFADLSGCVLIDYHGINSEETTDLRNALRQKGNRMTVVKNRLSRIALVEQEGIAEGFTDLFSGPVAVIHGEGGAIGAAKAIDQWKKDNKGKAEIKGGLFEGKVLSVADVDQLAKIPDKEELLMGNAARMLSPLQALLNAVQSVTTNFVGCAKAKAGEGE